jgi:hypothetical protein
MEPKFYSTVKPRIFISGFVWFFFLGLAVGTGIVFATDYLGFAFAVFLFVFPLGIAVWATIHLKRGALHLTFVLFLLYVLMIPTLHRLLVYSLPEVKPFLTFIQNFFASLFLVLGIQSRRRHGSKNVRVSWIHISTILILFLAPFGAIISLEPFLVFYGLQLTYLPMVFYFAFYLLETNSTDNQFFLDCLIMAGFIVGLLGIFLYFILPRSLYLYFFEIGGGVSDARAGLYRMGSIFWTPVVFGAYMAICSTLSLAMLHNPYLGRAKKTLYICTLGICLFTLLFSVSTGSWLAAGIGALVVSICFRKTYNLIKLLILLGFVVFVALNFLFLGYTSFEVMGSSSQFEQIGHSMMERTDQWIRAIESFQIYPFGRGLGWAGHVAWRFQENYNIELAVTDGWLFKVIGETGLVGLMVWTSYFIILFLIGIKIIRRKKGSHKFIAVGIFSVLIGAIGQSLGTNLWDVFFVSPILWILTGILVTIERLPGNGKITSSQSVKS